MSIFSLTHSEFGEFPHWKKVTTVVITILIIIVAIYSIIISDMERNGRSYQTGKVVSTELNQPWPWSNRASVMYGDEKIKVMISQVSIGEPIEYVLQKSRDASTVMMTKELYDLIVVITRILYIGALAYILTMFLKYGFLREIRNPTRGDKTRLQ